MGVLPVHTQRLTVRMLRATDVATYHAYRNDPENARYQTWEMPFPLEIARSHADAQAHHDDIIIGEWTTMAIELDGRQIGDVVTKIENTGTVAEIGFTLDRAFHGKGYATEAAGAVVEALFTHLGVARVVGELDPVNVASQRVLESVGLVFESITKQSFLSRGVWTDNMSYAATAQEHAAWRARPMNTPDVVSLVDLGPHNRAAYGALTTHYSQQRFVAPMAGSFRDALLPDVENGHPAVPWFRGIEADGQPAGFVMVAEAGPGWPEPILWRLLIDRLHQRRGIATLALSQLYGRLRAQGHRTVLTSWVDGPGSPAPFYLRQGFVPTGERWDGEIVARGDLHGLRCAAG